MGFFDGVHIGHRRIIDETLATAAHNDAAAVVVTFDAHPSTVVAPSRVPPLLQTLPQRLRTIAAEGVGTILLFHFDGPFSRQPADGFIRSLVRDLPGVLSIHVGANFHFGFRRSGNVAVLSNLGQELGFTVHGISAVTASGEPVSSTRIRDAVGAGQLDLASALLDRPYSLAGRIVHGDGLGRQLGFPTANIDTTGLVIPPGGVYLVQSGCAAPSLKGVLNIGVRPTLNDPTPRLQVEAHLLGFDGDLYGQELELVFRRKIRDERKFPSLEALRAQIARDVEFARSAE